MKTLRKLILAGGILMPLLLNAALASTVITPLDLDTWPDGWSKIGPAQASIVTRDGSDYLQLARVDANTQGAIAFWNGDETVEDGWFNLDYSGSVVVRFTSDNNDRAVLGVVVGAQRKAYTSVASTNFEGYYIAIYPRSSDDDVRVLGVWYNPLTSTQLQNVTPLESAPLPNTITQSGTYLMEFSVTGNVIGASFWSLDDDDEKVSLIASLSWEASEESLAGYFGLMGGRFGGSVGAQFRDLEITVIPEPSSVILSLVGAIFLGVSVFNRRGRRH